MDKIRSLSEFSRVLKKSGYIILTLDHPDTNMGKIKAMAEDVGLKVFGEMDTTMPPNAITWENKLYCFRMVLSKG
jgi:hypothetical protein